jgi:hypothetical protein
VLPAWQNNCRVVQTNQSCEVLRKIRYFSRLQLSVSGGGEIGVDASIVEDMGGLGIYENGMFEGA